jgi:hypothetical protein
MTDKFRIPRKEKKRLKEWARKPPSYSWRGINQSGYNYFKYYSKNI